MSAFLEFPDGLGRGLLEMMMNRMIMIVAIAVIMIIKAKHAIKNGNQTMFWDLSLEMALSPISCFKTK